MYGSLACTSDSLSSRPGIERLHEEVEVSKAGPSQVTRPERLKAVTIAMDQLAVEHRRNAVMQIQ